MVPIVLVQESCYICKLDINEEYTNDNDQVFPTLWVFTVCVYSALCRVSTMFWDIRKERRTFFVLDIMHKSLNSHVLSMSPTPAIFIAIHFERHYLWRIKSSIRIYSCLLPTNTVTISNFGHFKTIQTPSLISLLDFVQLKWLI